MNGLQNIPTSNCKRDPLVLSPDRKVKDKVAYDKKLKKPSRNKKRPKNEQNVESGRESAKENETQLVDRKKMVQKKSKVKAVKKGNKKAKAAKEKRKASKEKEKSKVKQSKQEGSGQRSKVLQSKQKSQREAVAKDVKQARRAKKRKLTSDDVRQNDVEAPTASLRKSKRSTVAKTKSKIKATSSYLNSNSLNLQPIKKRKMSARSTRISQRSKVCNFSELTSNSNFDELVVKCLVYKKTYKKQSKSGASGRSRKEWCVTTLYRGVVDSKNGTVTLTKAVAWNNSAMRFDQKYKRCLYELRGGNVEVKDGMKQIKLEIGSKLVECVDGDQVPALTKQGTSVIQPDFASKQNIIFDFKQIPSLPRQKVIQQYVCGFVNEILVKVHTRSYGAYLPVILVDRLGVGVEARFYDPVDQERFDREIKLNSVVLLVDWTKKKVGDILFLNNTGPIFCSPSCETGKPQQSMQANLSAHDFAQISKSCEERSIQELVLAVIDNSVSYSNKFFILRNIKFAQIDNMYLFNDAAGGRLEKQHDDVSFMDSIGAVRSFIPGQDKVRYYIRACIVAEDNTESELWLSGWDDVGMQMFASTASDYYEKNPKFGEEDLMTMLSQYTFDVLVRAKMGKGENGDAKLRWTLEHIVSRSVNTDFVYDEQEENDAASFLSEPECEESVGNDDVDLGEDDVRPSAEEEEAEDRTEEEEADSTDTEESGDESSVESNLTDDDDDVDVESNVIQDDSDNESVSYDGREGSVEQTEEDGVYYV